MDRATLRLIMNDVLQQEEKDKTPSQIVGKELAHLFSEYLLANAPALEYLEKRGIPRSLVEQERVGYCPPFISYWFPLLKGRIVVPIMDVHNQVIAFAGRIHELSAEATKNALRQMYHDDLLKAEKKVEQWERGKWLNETYPKTKHLFNLNVAKRYARELGYLIVVEGYFDALTLESHGLKNVVALCGTSFSDIHVALVARYCKRVVLLLDGDDAGVKAQNKMIPKLEAADILYNSIYLPDGYDPDQIVLKLGGKRLKKIIETIINDNTKMLKIKLKE